jgi:hypothetical protein
MDVRWSNGSVRTSQISLLLVGTLLLDLAGCSFAPRVVGPVHPPIPVSQVTVFERPDLPLHDVVVARLDATGYGGYSSVGVDAVVLQRLCRQAARLGANGIILSPEPPSSGGDYRYGGYINLIEKESHSCGTPSTRFCYRVIPGMRNVYAHMPNRRYRSFRTVAVDLPRGVGSSAHWKTILAKVRKYFPQCVPQKPRTIHSQSP